MKLTETIKLSFKWWNTWHTLPVLAWVRAAALYRTGHYQEAERHYLSGLQKYTDHPASLCARLDLSYCLFKTGDLEESERHLRYVTTRAPENREAFMRLARLQMWTGHAVEAAWTMRRALQKGQLDSEIVATFLLAVLDAEGPVYLLSEAMQYAQGLSDAAPEQCDRLKLAFARFDIAHGEYEKGRAAIAEMACRENAIFEAILYFSEILVKEGKIAHARRQLRRAMSASAEHPRLLSVLAQSYLKSGPFYNPEFARQHATKACQATRWMSPREMHVMAEAYFHTGDKISALLIASRAKQAGNRLMGSYPESRNLDQLIESLSAGTQA